MSISGSPGPPLPLSATDYHVLLVLAEEDLYGYAIMKAIEEDSRGAVSPEIGSLYRILARLMTEGFVDEIGTPKDTIEKAIKKGAGELDGGSYEEVLYEGYGAGGVAVMVRMMSKPSLCQCGQRSK